MPGSTQFGLAVLRLALRVLSCSILHWCIPTIDPLALSSFSVQAVVTSKIISCGLFVGQRLVAFEHIRQSNQIPNVAEYLLFGLKKEKKKGQMVTPE